MNNLVDQPVRLLVLLSALALSQALPAVAQSSFQNPCERGLLPRVAYINNERAEFISFLQTVRPNMPREIARTIAHQMCADLTLLNNSDGLTQRLNRLLKSYGY